MQIFTDKRHWWKVQGLLGSSIQIYMLPFSWATNSHTFSQMQWWMLKTSLIRACLPRKTCFFFWRSGSLTLGRAKDFKWRCSRSEWGGGKWWCKAKIPIIKGKGVWGELWTDSSSHYCSCDGHKAAVQDYLQDRAGAADLRAMTLLNSRAHSCSITVNLQSIRWPTTHEWNLAAFADASILEKKKIRPGYSFFPPLSSRCSITSITSPQQHQHEEIRRGGVWVQTAFALDVLPGRL